MPPLASLALRGTIRHLRRQVRGLKARGATPPHAAKLRECLEWVPPSCRAAMLHGLAPALEAAARRCTCEATLDLLDDMALALLSPAATLHVDRYQFPARRPERYLAGLASVRGLTALASRGVAEWKTELRPVRALADALTNMPRLRRLQLRHLNLQPDEEMVTFLHEVARGCPLLTELDLKHGAVTDSCIAPLLSMPRLTHLNVNITKITAAAVETLLRGCTALLRLEAIVCIVYHRNPPIHVLCDACNEFYGDNEKSSAAIHPSLLCQRCSDLFYCDLQAFVISSLLQQPSPLPLPLPPPLPLARTTYTLAPDEMYVGAVCRACPLLQRVSVWHCEAVNLKPLLVELGGLRHLRAINLCGLQWSLLDAGVAVNDEPMPLSTQVVEVTLTASSCVDAAHLGALGICFPRVTHLRVVRARAERVGGGRPLPWDGGRVFSHLLHLFYEGDLLIGKFGRLQRQQGLHSQLDVLLGWCEGLRSLTLYTTTIEEQLLMYALRNNRLRHLEELRIGQQRDLTCGALRAIVEGTDDLRVLGRVDWWKAVTLAERRSLLVQLRRRFRRLEIFGEENEEEEEEEEDEEEEGRPDLEEDPDLPRCVSPDEW